MPWTSLASAVSIIFPADPEADGGQVQRRMDGLLVPRDRDIAVFLAIPLLFRVGAWRAKSLRQGMGTRCRVWGKLVRGVIRSCWCDEGQVGVGWRVAGDAKLRLTNIVYRGRRSGSEMERLRRTCVFGKGPISDAV